MSRETFGDIFETFGDIWRYLETFGDPGDPSNYPSGPAAAVAAG